MDLSVVICTYNRATFLTGLLTALQMQNVRSECAWEIAVVDNNSGDNTRQVVRDFASVSPVRVNYELEPTQGKCFALNTGIALTSGAVIAFTDDDCVPEPTWIQGLLDAMDTWKADGVGGRILPIWPSPSPPPSWITAHIRLVHSLAILEDTVVREVTLASRVQENGFRIWGANMAFRRSLFDAVGGFSTRRGPTGSRRYDGEEAEFLTRVLKAGKRVVFDPTPTVRHHITADRLSKPYFRRRAFDRGAGDARFIGVPRSRHLLGIPPFLVRILGEHVLAWLRALPGRNAETYYRELDVVEDLGYMAGYVSAALRSHNYLSLRGM